MGRGLGLGLLLRLPGQELLRVPPEEGVDHDVPGLRAREHAAQVLDLTVLRNFGKLLKLFYFGTSANFRSFSAVSAPIFARKYAFFSIFQNLPDYLAENFEIWQYFANFATFAKFLLNFHENC